MQCHEFRLNTAGCAIFGFYTQPKTINGVIVLVHGFGEHAGRYIDTVIPALVKANFAVVTYDNVGHGKSGGKRGHCPSYKALLDILGAVIEKANSLFAKQPLFLYGHSMGGNLVLNYVLRRKPNIKALVATSPYLRLAFQPPKWKMILGKIMLRIMPSITLSTGLDSNDISRMPEETTAYETDPLVHDKVSPMFSFPVMEAGEWAIQNAGTLQVPTLLLHGTADAIIDCKGSEDFYKNAAEMTTFKRFEGAYHELHNDVCKDEMLALVTNWLQQHFV